MQRLTMMTMLGVAAAMTMSAPAATLDSAEALWKFDAAASGSVSASQIVDSNNGHDASYIVETGTTNPSSLNWTTTPSPGPGSLPAVDDFGGQGRGLEFNKTIEAAGDPPTTNSPGFVVNGLMTGGSATLVTRMRWDGQIADPRSWLYSNGSATSGWLFGISGSSQLSVYQHNTTYDTLANDLPALTPGQWYDVAVVIRDDVEEGAASDTFTFYMVGPDGKLHSQTRDRGTLFDGSNSSGNTQVGGENLGQGSGNQRKGFDGALDYMAIWDSALSDEQVTALLVPAPGALPAGLALLGLGAMRRRR